MSSKRKPYKDRAGNIIPSVTEILKECQDSEPLMGWAYKIAQHGKSPFAERAHLAEIGTQTHDLIQRFFSGKDFKGTEHYHVAANKAFEAFTFFFDRNIYVSKFVALELKMVCECPYHLPFGGTFDFISKKYSIDLYDWKTSQYISENYLLQLLGYAHLWEFGYVCDDHEGALFDKEALNSRIDILNVVELSKTDESFHLYSFSHQDDQDQFWLDCVDYYHSKQKVKRLL